MHDIGLFILAAVAGIIVGIVIMKIAGKAGLDRNKTEAETIINDANSKADSIVRQADLDGKQQIYDIKLKAENEIKTERDKLQQNENKLLRREDNLKFREQNLSAQEKKISDKEKSADDRLANLSKMQEDLQSQIDKQIEVLEQTAHLSQEDAKKELMAAVTGDGCDPVRSDRMTAPERLSAPAKRETKPD